MQQQAFAAVEEASAQDVVVEKRQARADHDIEEAESNGTIAGHGHLRAQRRVTIHVLQVAFERGISVMQKMILQLRRWTAYLDVFVYEAIFEFACTAAKEA